MKKIDKSSINFTIVGDGKEKSELEKLADELQLDNVNFTGKIDAGLIPEIYKKADIIINYRRDEPVAHQVTPLKPLEAMAYKKLVLVSDVKGMTELVKNHINGIVIKPENVDVLASSLKDVIENPTYFNNIIINGRGFVEKRTWSEVGRKYLKVY